MPKTHGQPKARAPRGSSTKGQPKAKGKGPGQAHEAVMKHPKGYK